nr:hypothetical protein [Saprospiraceae bacterium]
MEYYFKLFTLVLVLILFGCNSDSDPDPDTPDPGEYTLSEDCSQDTVYFVNDIRPILISYCATSGCHDPVTSEGDMIVVNYNSLMNSNKIVRGNPMESQLYQRITSSSPDLQMPPPGEVPLNTRQIDLIETWIAQGARNNECIGECETENLNYNDHIAVIIKDYCGGCHGGNDPEGGLFLENYFQVRAVGMDGRLLGTIRAQQGHIPMPFYGSMTDCEVDQIAAWVFNDMPE